MSIKRSFEAGRQAALIRFKLAAGNITATTTSPGAGPVNNAQSPAVAMSMAIPKPVVPTTAPVAPGAAKATVL